MGAFFQFLAANPYLLLFLTVGLAVGVGRITIKGYGLGMVAAAIVMGTIIAVWASTYGVELQLNEFTKLLFYYLFMYGVGLRVGPSFVNSLGRDGLRFTVLSVVSCGVGLLVIVVGSRLFDLPVGAAGGILAGSQTMSAAIGTAQQAITSGAVKLPAGTSKDDASAMIALSYGITYVWGTIGIVLITKYLPKWWGIDARKAAADYEREHGVSSAESDRVTGWQEVVLRSYRLENPAYIGKTVGDLMADNEEYRIANIVRGDESLPVDRSLTLAKDDVIALGGAHTAMTQKMGLIGPEVSSRDALDINLDKGEILVTHKDAIGKTLGELRQNPLADTISLLGIERGGASLPPSREIRLQRMDILSVVGVPRAVSAAADIVGRIVRPSIATDLLTLSAGMVLGLLIGMVDFPAFGARVGLGSAGGLLISGVIVSSLSSRLRFFGNTPSAARNVLEDLGLVVFVAIVGINAGSSLLSQLSGLLALKIFLIGFVGCSLPPVMVWCVGHYVFRMNPAVLMGGVAGARSHSGPCREAAVEIGSNVPWIGFPVAYAVSGVILTVLGYFATLLGS